ncbi:MAG TPA: chlorophyll synthase ChlG [Chloroflexia bacterium]|nr:chlorophyll synthase ChlG [Chloroflexia bacterium]
MSVRPVAPLHKETSVESKRIGLQTEISLATPVSSKTRLSYSLRLMKPITWFAPMWAFMCGAVAVGMNWLDFQNIFKLILGIVLAGPVLCGLSQVLNDWFDREVDAINEPERLIPSGKVSGGQVLWTIIVLALLGTAIPVYLGQPVAVLSALGFVLALTYSVHPIRAKRNGWVGNALVAISYEGLPWLAGSAAFGATGHSSWGAITSLSLLAAGIYSFGAHGIMTVNDFKSIGGDTIMSIKTIPVLYGPQVAAWIALLIMDLAQIAMVVGLFLTGKGLNAGLVLVFLLVQLPLQRKFLTDPKGKAIWYNMTGTTLYVYGMLITAIGLGIN